MSWSPLKHSIVKDESTKEALHDLGYSVLGNIGTENVELLRQLYEELHGFKTTDGGMFYSLYSKDIDYRWAVHRGIEEIVSSVYDKYFENYRSVINSFIVKLPGRQSGFTLHQDSSGLNEALHSPLSLWIPLQETDLSNGTLCVVPKTHGFYHPLRSISFSPPFMAYETVLKRYLVPLTLKAGDILAFDNRLVHYSGSNLTEEPRTVVMSGLFPKDAAIEVCYKNPDNPDNPIEIYAQSDDFLITNEAFYENCTERPYRGEKIREMAAGLSPRSVYDFLSWASKVKLQRTDIPSLIGDSAMMHIVSEPSGS